MEGISKTPHAEALLRDFPHTPDGYVRIPENLLTDCNRLFDNYIFYESLGRGEKRYVCTNCYAHWYTPNRMESYVAHEIAHLHHNDMTHCPHCGERVRLKSLGRSKSRRSLDQTRNLLFLWAASETLVYGAAAYVYKNYSDEYESLQLDYSVDALYTFEPGESHSWKSRYSYRTNSGGTEFCETRTTAIPFASNIRYWLVRPVGLTDAVEHSFLRYCAYDKGAVHYNCRICDLALTDGDYIPDEEYAGEAIALWLADYCRYPGLEMLAKLGFTRIIDDTVMTKRRHPRVLNWRASTPQGFFRMSKQDFNALAKHARMVSVENLRDFREARVHDKSIFVDDFMKYNSRYTMETLTNVAKRYGLPFAKLVRYLSGAFIDNNFHVSNYTLTTYRDYLDMAEKLGYDLTQDAVKFPKKLGAAHDRAVAAYNAIKIERQKHEGAKLYAALAQRFAYETDEFLIRPPYCAAEIVAEGQALRHCVAGYVDSHCEGKTMILLLRRKDTPDVPYFTVEMDAVGGLFMKQIHGLRNKDPDTPELQAFVAKYKQYLADEKAKKESKSKKTAARIQVAV